MAKAKRSTINVALIGTKFMGRAHSNAWRQVNCFFDPAHKVSLHTVVGRNAKETAEFADRWGWAHATTDAEAVFGNPEIDLVDLGTPNDVHAEHAIAALAAGKHVACEKPLAGTLKDAEAMVAAARKVVRKGVRTFVWYNYRRCPAVALAHRLASEGRLGRIYHVRACYLQEWGGPATPLLWRFRGDVAGSGAHGDLNAHIIDMARFITGEEITEVSGAIEETFVKERAIPGSKKKGRSTVDDCVLFLARLSGGGVASFEATRLATGNKNRNRIEVNGEHGALRFDFERMNELEYYDNRASAAVRGWTNIMCTDNAAHPYAGNWWPDAHVLGYEHGFVNQAADIINVLCGGRPVVPLPDFEDALRTQRVLDAAIHSARGRKPVRIGKGRAVK